MPYNQFCLKVSLALGLVKLNKFMGKECFLCILRIMKRVRKQYAALHWNYNWHYSTRWMGVDRKGARVILLKSELERDGNRKMEDQRMDGSERMAVSALKSELHERSSVQTALAWGGQCHDECDGA